MPSNNQPYSITNHSALGRAVSAAFALGCLIGFLVAVVLM
jgi:hypothetical protein